MRIVWTPRALRELAAARVYIARNNPAAAARQIERIFVAVTTLLLFPEIGRPGRRAGTRELVVGRTPFIATYRHRGDAIEIMAILHGRQRWPDEF
jgi:toxin ParE1/3/4